MFRMFLALTILAGFAAPVLPCSVSPTALTTPSELVREAEVIVRARAEALSPVPAESLRGPSVVLTQVQFRIEAVLKGSVQQGRIVIPGYLDARDDRNSGTPPYEQIRPGGRHGPCYAQNYRAGRVYLLFLRAAHGRNVPYGGLTPYWRPLSPTGEQVFGPNDRWEAWVRKQVSTARVP